MKPVYQIFCDLSIFLENNKIFWFQANLLLVIGIKIINLLAAQQSISRRFIFIEFSLLGVKQGNDVVTNHFHRRLLLPCESPSLF
jgi:hypothetical protein